MWKETGGMRWEVGGGGGGGVEGGKIGVEGRRWHPGTLTVLDHVRIG